MLLAFQAWYTAPVVALRNYKCKFEVGHYPLVPVLNLEDGDGSSAVTVDVDSM